MKLGILTSAMLAAACGSSTPAPLPGPRQTEIDRYAKEIGKCIADNAPSKGAIDACRSKATAAYDALWYPDAGKEGSP